VRRLAAAAILALLPTAALAAPAGPVRRPAPAGPPAASGAWLLKPAALRSKPGGGRVVARIGTRTEFDTRRVLGVVESRGSWLRVRTSALGNGRTGWLHARRVVQEAVDWRVDASVSHRQVVVRHAGKVTQRFPVAVGRPGSETPTGAFAVTDKIHFRKDNAYGCCALALSGHQPRTPQGWGGGDRLAIHGTTNEASVGTAASLGCLRARRADIKRLVYSVPLGTPVRIRP
jgi:lipoprotein-anchoring transpeptidase ErfK/SrfK